MICSYYRAGTRAFSLSATSLKMRKRVRGFTQPKAYTTPLRTPSMIDSAKKLGFDKPRDMYPEYPLEKPPKLWMVILNKPLKGYPYWVKDIIKELGLYKEGDISIQINSPKMNEMLWSIKSVVKIQPINFPNGMPAEEDIGHTQLKSNGDFVITKTLESPNINDASIPVPAAEDYKIVDGYRMCRNCNAKRCLMLGMCQKLYFQGKKNTLQRVSAKLLNFVDNPEKLSK